MTLARRQAWISLIIWSAILVGLLAVLIAAGPERFSAPGFSRYRMMTAAILLPGYLLNTWLLWRARRGARGGELDERDERVARRASEVTLLVLAIVIYGVCVALWEVYKHAPGAPAGWFYVLAYLIVAVLLVVHSAARLICDSVGAVDG